jgi:probable rRNA maturation factor
MFLRRRRGATMISVEDKNNAALGKSVVAPPLRKTELTRFLSCAQKAVGLRGRVDVLLASDETLRRLNREFRRKDSATDVLSFPAADAPGKGNRMAGDLAISLETAARQASEHGHSLEMELKVLLLHGVLHLAGHDHERDDGAMLRLEQRMRRELGLPAGLIERAAAIKRRRSA